MNINQSIPAATTTTTQNISTNEVTNITQSQQITKPIINTTTVQPPLVFNNAEDLNKYFESIGTAAYNQVVSSTQNVVNNTNDEDLNKYFQPNAYTQNTNIDLASLGLQTSTTVQGASNANEINNYFQNSGASYNAGNIEYSEFKATTSSAAQNYSYNY